MAKKPIQSETFHVKFTHPWNARLKAVAKQEKRSINNMIRFCVENHIESAMSRKEKP